MRHRSAKVTTSATAVASVNDEKLIARVAVAVIGELLVRAGYAHYHHYLD